MDLRRPGLLCVLLLLQGRLCPATPPVTRIACLRTNGPGFQAFEQHIAAVGLSDSLVCERDDGGLGWGAEVDEESPDRQHSEGQLLMQPPTAASARWRGAQRSRLRVYVRALRRFRSAPRGSVLLLAGTAVRLSAAVGVLPARGVNGTAIIDAMRQDMEQRGLDMAFARWGAAGGGGDDEAGQQHGQQQQQQQHGQQHGQQQQQQQQQEEEEEEELHLGGSFVVIRADGGSARLLRFFERVAALHALRHPASVPRGDESILGELLRRSAGGGGGGGGGSGVAASFSYAVPGASSRPLTWGLLAAGTVTTCDPLAATPLALRRASVLRALGCGSGGASAGAAPVLAVLEARILDLRTAAAAVLPDGDGGGTEAVDCAAHLGAVPLPQLKIWRLHRHHPADGYGGGGGSGSGSGSGVLEVSGAVLCDKRWRTTHARLASASLICFEWRESSSDALVDRWSRAGCMSLAALSTNASAAAAAAAEGGVSGISTSVAVPFLMRLDGLPHSSCGVRLELIIPAPRFIAGTNCSASRATPELYVESAEPLPLQTPAGARHGEVGARGVGSVEVGTRHQAAGAEAAAASTHGSSSSECNAASAPYGGCPTAWEEGGAADDDDAAVETDDEDMAEVSREEAEAVAEAEAEAEAAAGRPLLSVRLFKRCSPSWLLMPSCSECIPGLVRVAPGSTTGVAGVDYPCGLGPHAVRARRALSAVATAVAAARPPQLLPTHTEHVPFPILALPAFQSRPRLAAFWMSLLQPRPRRILEIGGGGGNPVYRFLEFCPAEVLVLEPAAELVSPYLAAEAAREPWASAVVPCGGGVTAGSNHNASMHVVVSPWPLEEYLKQRQGTYGFDAIVCMGCEPRLGVTAARIAAAGALVSRRTGQQATITLYLEFALTDPDAVAEYQSIAGCEDGLSSTLELNGERNGQYALHVRQLKELHCTFI